MSARSRILAAYFVFGVFAVCAQAMLLREAQVLIFGCELSWGLVFAFWLAGVGIGAQAGGRLAQPQARAQRTFMAAGLLAPAALLLVIVFLRTARSILGVGPGEYVGPAAMVAVTLLATVPVSLWVGLSFPAAAALLARDAETSGEKARSVGLAYLVEAAGSLLGGVLFSFIFVDRVGAMRLGFMLWIVLAAAVLWAVTLSRHEVASEGSRCGICRSPVRTTRPFASLRVTASLTALAIVAGAAAWFLGGLLDDATVRWRWQSFAPQLELVRSEDTRHQNLALGRLDNQYSVYSNGLVAATWPNHGEAAIAAHLAACQHPRPRRILVLGGGAEGMLKELLRHKPARLDYVTLDPRGVALVRDHLDPADRAALDSLGDRRHFADARWFVKRAAARGDRYDLVLLAEPEPASTLEARLYTEDFFAELSRAMSDDGVLTLALSGAVGYWGPEPAEYVGSIVTPLERVFPDVLLTFGYPTRCFAAKRAGVLTDSGDVLAARYKERGVESPYFHPLWFAGASDLLDAEKRAALRRSLAAHPPRLLNTDDRPAAALYRMRFWLQTTAAAHAGPQAPAEQRADVLGTLMRLDLNAALAAAALATVLAAVIGRLRGTAAYRGTAVLWSVGTTGMASMAVEIVLLYTFQTLYGYVYSMVGVVVGVFMAGLVLGALAMNRRLAGRVACPGGRLPGHVLEREGHMPTQTTAWACHPGGGPGLKTLVAIDIALAVLAAALVPLLGVLRMMESAALVQAVMFALVAAAGVLGGLVFPLAAAIALRERPEAGRAAASVAAADYLGACLGALVTGALLVPVLGVGASCLVIAGVKVMSGLVTGLAATSSAPPASSDAA